MEDKYKSVKIPKETYEELKKLGQGISRAVTALVKSREALIEEKFSELESKGREIAELLFRYGVFDVRFAGGRVTSIAEDGDVLRIEGYVNVIVPHDEVRKKIVEVLKGG